MKSFLIFFGLSGLFYPVKTRDTPTFLLHHHQEHRRMMEKMMYNTSCRKMCGETFSTSWPVSRSYIIRYLTKHTELSKNIRIISRTLTTHLSNSECYLHYLFKAGGESSWDIKRKLLKRAATLRRRKTGDKCRFINTYKGSDKKSSQKAVKNVLCLEPRFITNVRK